MNVGSYNRIVTIQSVSYADSDYSDNETPTWVDELTDLAARLEFPGRTSGHDEGYEGNQRVENSQAIWTIMYPNNKTITTQMRLIYGGETYQINRVQEIGLRQELQLTTEKRDNE